MQYIFYPFALLMVVNIVFLYFSFLFDLQFFYILKKRELQAKIVIVI